MSANTAPENQPVPAGPFFARPGVRVESIPIGPGVPIGIERVSNPEIGIGGAYGAWGACCDNASLPALVEDQLGYSLGDDGASNLSELGFNWRHILRICPQRNMTRWKSKSARAFCARPRLPVGGSLRRLTPC